MLVVPSLYPGYDDIYSTAVAPLINDFLAGLASFAKFFKIPEIFKILKSFLFVFLIEFDNFPIR